MLTRQLLGSFQQGFLSQRAQVPLLLAHIRSSQVVTIADQVPIYSFSPRITRMSLIGGESAPRTIRDIRVIRGKNLEAIRLGWL